MDEGEVQYIGQKCPSCGALPSHDPLPLYIILGVLGLFLILFLVIYVKYLLVKKESNVCMNLRGVNHYTENESSNSNRNQRKKQSSFLSELI